MERLRFEASQRLKSRKRIGEIFSKRQSVGGYPLRFFWLKVPQEEQPHPLQVGFSVPKKKFKRAVDRNRLKRLIREAYRLQKLPLIKRLKQQDQALVGMWVYVGKDEASFDQISAAVTKVIERLMQELG